MLFLHTLLYSLIQYSVSTYYVPGTVPGSGDTVANQADIPVLKELVISLYETCIIPCFDF